MQEQEGGKRPKTKKGLCKDRTVRAREREQEEEKNVDQPRTHTRDYPIAIDL